MVQSVMFVPQSSAQAEPPVMVVVVVVPVAQVCTGLLDLFSQVSYGRSDQGRGHPVAAVLALATVATVAGTAAPDLGLKRI